MKKFKEIIKNKKKYVAAASVAVLSFGALGVMPTLATMDEEIYKVASMLGIEKNLDEYSTVVNQMITSKEGISVGIGEVIYDQHNHTLRVITYITSPEKIEEDTIWSTFTRVRINGEEINGGGLFSRKDIDENTVAFIEDHQIDKELVGKLDMSIFIPQVEVNDKLYYNTQWKYEFTTDGEKLAIDTQVVELGNKIELSNGKTLELIKYTANTLGQNIFFKTDDLLHEYLMEIRGEDNLGNKITFQPTIGFGGKGGAMKMTEDSKIAEDAESMTLGLYAIKLPEQDGPIEGECELVGETFNVKLNKGL